jgi:hypothetical protein
LVADGASDLVELLAAGARAFRSGQQYQEPDDVAYCRERLAWPADRLNPPPLLTGDDLRRHGVQPGPVFARLLEALRDAQLDGKVRDRNEALEFVDRFQVKFD